MKKRIFFSLFIVLGVSLLFSAVDVIQAGNSYIYTDSNASRIYSYDSQVHILAEGPGCGSYYSVSSDGSRIGFKQMDVPGGLQAPAVFDLQKGKRILLHDAVAQAGQVSFSAAGHTAFTIAQKLHVISNEKEFIYDLGIFSNIAAISPDGKSLVFSDDDNRLWLMDLSSEKKTRLSETGCVEPQWSPNGNYIVYYVLDGSARLHNVNTGSERDLGTVSSVSWSSDEAKITYVKNKFTEEYMLVSRSIEEQSVLSGKVLAHYESSSECHSPFYAKSGDLNYIEGNKLLSYDKRSVLELPVDPVYFSQTEQVSSRAALDVPYIHQVYDTPGTYGYSSCGPTTAAMILAYYGILPEWPYKSGSNHWNDYGAYVHNKYYYNGTYFDLSYSGSSYTCYGGMGYMWNGGSPNSKMANYMSKHGVNTNQTWNTTWSQAKSAIDEGQPFTICVMLTSSGHLIAATGRVEGQKVVIANDPYGNKNTSGYPSYDGKNSYYDWPGENYGYVDLDAGYSGSYGSAIPWSIRSSFSMAAASDSLVDDKDFSSGFHIHAYSSTVPMRYYHSSNTGHNGHHWWTYTESGKSDICKVRWTPALDKSGYYEIKAFIPEESTASCAVYRINNAGGTLNLLVDQTLYNDKWASLGTFLLNRESDISVSLGDSSETGSERIAFDGMFWEKIKTAPIEFSANLTNTATYNHITFSALSHLSEGDYAYSWDFGDGQTADGLNVQHAYDFPGSYTVVLSVSADGVTYREEKANYIFITASSEPDFSLLFPVAEELISTQTPKLIWEASVNADSYLVYCEESLNLGIDTPSASDTASLILSNSLRENATYFWHVMALLNTGDTLSSDFQSFKVNSMNEEPLPFLLQSPADSIILNTDTPLLTWFSSSDPDPEDSVIYKLYIDEDCVYTGNDINYEIPEGILVENASYSWHVEAVDTYDAVTFSSSSRVFSVNEINEAPVKTQLLSPEEGSCLFTLYPEIIWNKATDPDPGDALTYKVYFWFLGSSYKNILTTADTSYNRKQFWDNKTYYMTVAAIDDAGLKTYSDTIIFDIDVSSSLVEVPEEYSLGANYPNPFNPVTVIPYQLPEAAYVSLDLYDLNGKVVKTLINEQQEAGFYKISIDAHDLSSGVYIYSLKTDSFQQNMKMLLIK